MDAKKIAAEMREEAARLIKAADILDPPASRKRRGRPPGSKNTPKDEPAPSQEPVAVVLDLGTAGHTAHPQDPDAEALRERLAFTTEEPA